MRHTLFFTFYLHAVARFARRGLARQPILRYTARSTRIDVIQSHYSTLVTITPARNDKIGGRREAIV